MWPQHMGVKGHLGVNDLWFKFFSKKCHCIHTLWCIFMGLGHNDPRVESHVRPQQMWGQRSSRGQLPLVQVFAKRSLYPHTLMYFHARLVVREPPCCASCGKKWILWKLTKIGNFDMHGNLIVNHVWQEKVIGYFSLNVVMVIFRGGQRVFFLGSNILRWKFLIIWWYSIYSNVTISSSFVVISRVRCSPLPHSVHTW